MSKIAFYNQQYRRTSAVACTHAFGATVLGRLYTYRIANGELCVQVPPTTFWHGYTIGADVLFPADVSQAAAVLEARMLLPVDAREVSVLPGINAPYIHQPGSCLSVEYSSSTLGSIVRAVSPKWSQFDLVTATLYSDRQTSSGSNVSYNGNVHEMSVQIGGHNFGNGHTPHC